MALFNFKGQTFAPQTRDDHAPPIETEIKGESKSEDLYIPIQNENLFKNPNMKTPELNALDEIKAMLDAQTAKTIIKETTTQPKENKQETKEPTQEKQKQTQKEEIEEDLNYLFPETKTITEQIADMHGYTRPSGDETEAVKEIHNQNFRMESHVPVAQNLIKAKYLGTFAMIMCFMSSAFGYVFDVYAAAEDYFNKNPFIAGLVGVIVVAILFWLEMVRHGQMALIKASVIPKGKKAIAWVVVLGITAVNMFGHYATARIADTWIRDAFNGQISNDIKDPNYMVLVGKKADIEKRIGAREDEINTKNGDIDKQLKDNGAMSSEVANTVATTIHANKREQNRATLEMLQAKGDTLTKSRIDGETDNQLTGLRGQLDATQKNIDVIEGGRSEHNQATASRLSYMLMIILMLLDGFALYYYLYLYQSKTSLHKDMAEVGDQIMLSASIESKLKRFMEQMKYMDAQHAEHRLRDVEDMTRFRQVIHNQTADILRRSTYQIQAHQNQAIRLPQLKRSTVEPNTVGIDSESDDDELDLKDIFDHINKNVFDGTLPKVQIFFDTLKNRHGEIRYLKNKVYSIAISDEIEDDKLFSFAVLAHEMAHMALILSKGNDTHDEEFKELCKLIGELLGFKVPINYKDVGESKFVEEEEATPIRQDNNSRLDKFERDEFSLEFNEKSYLYQLFKKGECDSGDKLEALQNMTFTSNNPRNRDRIARFRKKLQQNEVIIATSNSTYAMCSYKEAVKRMFH